MQIFCQCLNGQTLVIEAEPYDTIEQIGEKIQEKIDLIRILGKKVNEYEKFEDDINHPEKLSKIKYRLERFCSYYNELGD